MTATDPIISHFQMTPLLKAHRAGETRATTSIDLNLTQTEVTLSEAGIHYEAGVLGWADAHEVADSDNACYVLDPAGDGGALKPKKVFVFSEETRRHCSLYPTPSAPALLVAGLPMHRIKGVNPMQDTDLKIRAAQPTGIVLDTSMGLGYTAIGAARTAERVITIELDPGVEEVASYNPYSRDLFSHPRIERRIGDSADVIAEFDNDSFTRIIHDPPTIVLAGDLYSGAYYRELFRILRRGGRLFHYIGDLNSPSGGRTVRGVIERLGAAGFRNVARRPEAFAVIAFK
jgi:hypothetical protein